jgi:cysteine synthase
LTPFVVANDITELIGNTPMVKINKLIGPKDARLYAKLEWFNIGGSVKDRMALYMIESAEAAGKIRKDKTILEATSGNSGISLAMIAAVKGYKITIIMPKSVSIERRKLIKAYGADLILSAGSKGTSGAIELKQKMLKENPNKYNIIDQFADPSNIQAHYDTTGKEILEQTDGKVDIVVVGIGTSGTGVGTSMRLKKESPKTKIVGVVPKIGVSIQGIRNPDEPYPTKLFKREYFDEIIEISEEEIPKIIELARKSVIKEGILMGFSAAAIMYVALRKSKGLGKNKLIVAVLPDNGMKYLSTPLFELY